MPDSYSIYEAKTNFSMIVRDSAEHGKVFMVGNAQREASPRAVILGENLLRLLLDRFICHPEWEEDAEKGMWTVSVSEAGAWGEGNSKSEAVQDLLENAKALSEGYLEEADLYLRFGRTEFLPMMLKIALARDEAGLQRTLGL